MDIVSQLAAITAVSGLAVKLYKALNEIIHDITVVPDYLVVLKSQLYIFIFSLRHLRRYIKKKSPPKSHVQEIHVGLEGGNTIIKQIDRQLSVIRFEEVRIDGKIVRKVPSWDRLQTWLNEELITKWTNQLAAHCGPLQLLLRSQELDPTDSDDELSLELSDSTPLIDEPAIKDWIQEEEKDLPEDKTSWWPSWKQKAAQKVRDGKIQLHQQYRQLLSMKSQEFNEWQLRIAVLGRGGVGKTRLSSYVCDLPYVDDTLNGEKTPPERILTAMNTEQRKRLALHDSGGLEGSRTVDFVRNFISSTQKLPIRDQIHAIWYVISCSDPKRAVLQTDEEFLAGKLIDTGEIPIFVVFSQYDELRSYVWKQLQKTNPGVSEDEINQETYKQFDKIYKQATKFIKDESKISFSRVGIRDDGSEYLQPDDGGPPFGLENLTKQIESRLPNGYLQIQFVAIQQKDDRAKLYDSINTSIALLFTARSFTKWSVLPGICLFGVTGVYYLILNVAATFWKIEAWADRLSLKVLRAIFDQDKFDQYGSINMLTLNIAGSLTMSRISRITLQMIVGINLIGRRIFRRQALSETPLTPEDIKAEITDFQKSRDRKRLAEIITSERMAEIDYKKSDAVDQISCVAREALTASVGFVDDAFFSKERLRIMKELSAVGVAQ